MPEQRFPSVCGRGFPGWWVLSIALRWLSGWFFLAARSDKICDCWHFTLCEIHVQFPVLFIEAGDEMRSLEYPPPPPRSQRIVCVTHRSGTYDTLSAEWWYIKLLWFSQGSICSVTHSEKLHIFAQLLTKLEVDKQNISYSCKSVHNILKTNWTLSQLPNYYLGFIFNNVYFYHTQVAVLYMMWSNTCESQWVAL